MFKDFRIIRLRLALGNQVTGFQYFKASVSNGIVQRWGGLPRIVGVAWFSPWANLRVRWRFLGAGLVSGQLNGKTE